MPIELFGFKLGKSKKEKREQDKAKSFVIPKADDGSVVVEGGPAYGGAYGTYVDLEGTVRNEYELVARYREMAMHHECDHAIDEIINDSIITDENEPAVTLALDKVEFSDAVKEKIHDEFKEILRLLDFKNQAYEIYRRWYIDGRLYYHVILDDSAKKKGIIELRNIDPRNIRKIKEVSRTMDPQSRSGTIVKVQAEYYLYSMYGLGGATTQGGPGAGGMRIEPDAIVFIHSGLPAPSNTMIVSHMHKAIRPLNQLRMLEDAAVIYRIARAPERRIFYIDVGNLPRNKAEEYLRSVMARYKNKLVYDSSTGDVRDDRRHMSMLEDYWLPRRDGANTTEIETLPGGQNLGEINDLQYFLENLYKALNVPVTRLRSESGFAIGYHAATEITRDELKFTKFIERLRLRFSHLFHELLKRQLSLKGITSTEEYEDIKDEVHFNFASDSAFSELKDFEMLKERLNVTAIVDAYIGKYFSEEYVRRHILKQSDDQIRQMDKEMEEEAKKKAETEAKYGDQEGNGEEPPEGGKSKWTGYGFSQKPKFDFDKNPSVPLPSKGGGQVNATMKKIGG